MKALIVAHFKTVVTILGTIAIWCLIVKFPFYALMAFGGFCFIIAYFAIYSHFITKRRSDFDDWGPR